jgi:hypothetical protein
VPDREMELVALVDGAGPGKRSPSNNLKAARDDFMREAEEEEEALKAKELEERHQLNLKPLYRRVVLGLLGERKGMPSPFPLPQKGSMRVAWFVRSA